MYMSLHSPWFNVSGYWPGFPEHIVIGHEFSEETHAESVMLNFLMTVLAAEGLLHFGRAVEELEVGGSKILALLVLTLADDNFEEIEKTGDVNG